MFGSQLPGIGSWLYLFFIPMESDKKDIRKNVTILALDNLIQNYTNALEDKYMDPPLSNEERELADLIIKEAKEMLTEIATENTKHIIPRPKWK